MTRASLVEIAFEDGDGWALIGPPITIGEWIARDPDGANEALSLGLMVKRTVYIGGGAAPYVRVRLVPTQGRARPC